MEDGGLPTQQAIGIVVAILVVLGWAIYLFANSRRTKPEVGSEIELAANRKPYLDDDELEGTKLNQALRWGLISMTIVAVGLPLYWLAEPGRQSGAIDNFDETFASRGGGLFAATDQGGFNCAGCHGGDEGLGAPVPYTLSEAVLDEDGEAVLDEDGEPETTLRQVQWLAPALNTVTLRMTDEQIRDVLTYGRPFSPMPAWGIEGGGPMNEQQIDNLIAYLHSIEITPEAAQEQAQEAALAEQERIRGLPSELAGAEDKVSAAEGDDEREAAEATVARIEAEIALDQPASYGAALFNTNCARCHTSGWSYGESGEPGGGAMGPPLANVLTQFPLPEEHVEWVTNGVEVGEQYGRFGQNEGRMPYFGRQLTREQIAAIIEYERDELSQPIAETATSDDAEEPS